MKLYYLKGACSLVPHIALEWVGKPYVAIEASREEIKKPEYLALNPQGSVPLLIDGDFVLSQNIAILSYLDTLNPEAKLFGSKTAQDKAKAMKWLAFCNADLHKAFGPLFHLPDYAKGNEELTNSIRQAAAKQVLTLLTIANEHLSQHLYFGEQLSVADIYLYVELRWCKLLSLDYSPLVHLEPFYQRVSENPGVKAALAKQGLPA
ncbi:glutathione S-transferase family protein [Actinobacillus porcinus]|uniref:glutathione S-transferase family protein n=1 Tax=Actinobacillus porcinus TaxID=51048 RepID=UPI0023F48D94|nr:glutathione S-transferase N-terminal domain-containing protein [Actinobacillus porcinus]MDD7545434.1 glutathione S-transferase N-terminal domain-containing protein [Actinobacillus porcinus]MDY5848749.1 glutathione S-transferase N-terminal domain-containing protein [Actinobacillus porcinus]